MKPLPAVSAAAATRGRCFVAGLTVAGSHGSARALTWALALQLRAGWLCFFHGDQPCQPLPAEFSSPEQELPAAAGEFERALGTKLIQHSRLRALILVVV